MDYRYIEQLIERYFQGETTLAEERILREFFAQDDVPGHLAQWKDIFAAQHTLANARLTDDFDHRLLQLIGQEQVATPQPQVKARRITLYQRLRPLFRAAAMVAFAIVIGTIIEHTDSNAGMADAETNTAQDLAAPQPTTQYEVLSAGLVEQYDTMLMNTQESLRTDAQ